MAEAALMMVTDRRLVPAGALPGLAAEAACAGADFIQVREKDLGDGERARLATAVRQAVAETPTRVLVNGRPDVALVAGAHGVQLPASGLPAAAVRRSFPGLLVGVSCHSLEEVAAAEREGADFALLGPVFPSTGKPYGLGLEALSAAASRVALPVYAIGGITPDNAAEAVRAGAAGLAAIRAFAERPAEAVRLFRARLREARP